MALNGDALMTLESARRHVLRSGTDTSKDTELEELVNDASRAIRNYCQREFTRPVEPDADVARTFNYCGSGLLTLAPFELRSVTTMTLDGQALTVATKWPGQAEYRLRPREKTPDGTYLWVQLGSSLEEVDVVVTGRWGINAWQGSAAVPPDVGRACRLTIAEWYRNPEGFDTRSLGEFIFTAGEASEVERSIPRAARALLSAYRRILVA